MKQTYHVATTEFWRLSRAIKAESPQDALTTFGLLRDLGSLPEPTRTLLGSIPDPEEIRNARGKLVYTNRPPDDDAERMLFLEMWRRMKDAPQYRFALHASINFICSVKGWDPTEVRIALNE